MQSFRQPVDLARATRLLNHGPVTLITSAHDGRSNVMAASWAMPLDFVPPKLVVVIDAGVEIDKFTALQLETFPAEKIDVPMLEGCVAWFECKVIPDDAQRHDLILAEVVACYADSRVYSDNRWHFGDDHDMRTCHYVAGGTFFETGDTFEVEAAPVGDTR